MNICPKVITIRRKKINEEDIETDQLPITPTYDSIASIKNIIIHFDEAVSIMFLAFHTTNNAYCAKYKNKKADKKVCDNKNIQYVHFSLDGCHPDDSEYLVAFLPRFVNYSELSTLTDELCNIAEWLDIKQINCIVFRYGAPVHGMDNSTHWQRQFDKTIKETKKLFMLYKIAGKIKHIPTSLKEKNITISKNIPLENINVS